MRRCALVVALAALLLAPSAAFAQTPQPSPSASTSTAADGRLRIFLDCYECDTEYLRQTVGFVDYVRDRTVADLHVLVTTQSTGGGGASWTMQFIGLQRFQGQDRTQAFTTPQTATSDERRREFARMFRLGLVPYAGGTPLMQELDVTWRRPVAAAPAVPTRDPWNFWVFRTNASGNSNGEQRSSSRSYRVSFSANRVTENWKINLSGNTSVNRSSFSISDTITVKSSRDSWSMNALVVKSAGPKWSFGSRGSVSQSTFANTRRSVSFSPGIEFDFFPYSESTRRSLTVQYGIGTTHYQYRELTVYDKLEETVPSHSVTASLGLRQPWGSVGVFTSVSQHLNHTDRYRASIFGNTDIRLFKGFSFNVFASYDKIKDQITLPKGTATPEEVLLRLRQLATNYSYGIGFGVSYSFGSIYNTVVNPRFGGSGGGMTIIMF